MAEARLIFNTEKDEGYFPFLKGYNWLLTRYSWKMESSTNNWFCRQLEKWKVPSTPDYYNPCRQLEKRKVPSTPEGHVCASSCALCWSHGVLHRTINPQGEQIIVEKIGEKFWFCLEKVWKFAWKFPTFRALRRSDGRLRGEQTCHPYHHHDPPPRHHNHPQHHHVSQGRQPSNIICWYIGLSSFKLVHHHFLQWPQCKFNVVNF